MNSTYLQSFMAGIKRTAIRFPIAMVVGVICAVYCSLLVEKVIADNLENMWIPMYLMYVSVLSLVLTIMLEKYAIQSWIKALIQVAIIGVGAVLTHYMWDLVLIRHKGFILSVMIAFVSTGMLLLSCLPFLSKNSSRAYVNYSLRVMGYQLKAGLIFWLVQLLLMGVLFAFMAMFFEVNDMWEHLSHVTIFCQLGAFVYFASQFTETKDIYDNDTVRGFHAAKLFGYYVFLPIIAVYLFVIYLFCIKLLVSDTVPEFSFIYGGFLYAICLFTMYLLYNEVGKKKIADFYARWIWVLLLPVLLIMGIELSNNMATIDDTFKTAWCWYFVCLCGIDIYLFVTKGKQLKWITVSCIALLWLFLYTPKIGFKASMQRTYQKELQATIEEYQILLPDSTFYMGQLCNKLNEMRADTLNSFFSVEQDCGHFNEAVAIGATTYLQKACVNFDANYRIILDESSYGTPMDSTYVDKPGYWYRYVDINLLPDSIQKNIKYN